MKKAVYPLVAALILCLVGIGMLLSARVGDRQEINRLQSEVAGLLEEQAEWDAQKAQVSKSLSGVRSVLVKTLVDLEDVATSLGAAMDSMDILPQEPEASKEPAATKPADSPEPTAPEMTATAAPAAASPTPTPESTQEPSTPSDKPGSAASAAPVQEEAAEQASPTPTPKSTDKP